MLDKIKNIEYAGWGFFLVTLVVLAGPCVYLAWATTHEGSMTVGVRLVYAAAIDVVVSGVITWLANDLLHRRNVRRYEAERKVQRKADKKSKKKKK